MRPVEPQDGRPPEADPPPRQQRLMRLQEVLQRGRSGAVDADMEDKFHARPGLYSNSMITSSTLRLAPGAAAIFFTRPLRSARRMFSIFIASTVASA